MNDLLRAFGRALSSALHPRMLWLTFKPFAVATIVWGAVLYLSWQWLVGSTQGWLDAWSFTTWLYHVFDWVGLSRLHQVVAPFVVIVMTIPLIVVSVLLLIATLSMPAVVRHLSARQFASLEMRRGGTWYGSILHSVWTTVVCLVLLVVTVPLWIWPPFFALVPPLLWGWLTYRVMTYDALALHASGEERRALVKRYRLPLLTIGVASGLLGSLPTLIWVWSAWWVVMFPVVTAITIWIYALILVFTALWFAWFCLRALQRMRMEAQHAHPAATLPY